MDVYRGPVLFEPGPNWVGTRVPLRLWTNGTVIATLKNTKKNFFIK